MYYNSVPDYDTNMAIGIGYMAGALSGEAVAYYLGTSRQNFWISSITGGISGAFGCYIAVNEDQIFNNY